jgi:hypothetical protein
MPISFSALAVISERDVGAGPPAVIMPALKVCSAVVLVLVASAGDLRTGFATVAFCSAAANGEATGFIGVDATRLAGSEERAIASAAGVGRVTARVCGQSGWNPMA